MSFCRIQIVWLIAASCLISAEIASAELYRWVDEQGNVHYSDHVPPEQSKKRGHEVINKQGTTLNKVDREKTAEEVAKEKLQRQAEETRLAEEAREAKRDYTLLQTFTTERDLLIARDEWLSIIDSNILITEKRLEEFKEKRLGLAAKRKGYLTEVKPVPGWVEEKLADINERIKHTSIFIDKKRRQRMAIQRSFDSDLARFRELQALKAQGKLKLKLAP